MQELTIILQALLAKKSKYAKKILHQIHILDINVADLILH